MDVFKSISAAHCVTFSLLLNSECLLVRIRPEGRGGSYATDSRSYLGLHIATLDIRNDLAVYARILTAANKAITRIIFLSFLRMEDVRTS
jgi:hypothetical protein